MRFQHPIKNVWYVTVPFGERYIFGIHKGTDFRTKTNEHPNGIDELIYIVYDGEYEFAGYNRIYGNHVIINHGNNIKTLYAHLSRLFYQEGWTKVKAGDSCGLSGNTGMSIGAHLHFGLQINGQWVDPMPYFKAGDKLIERLKNRPIIRVENHGEIKMLIKNGIVDLKKNNCWDIISQNALGINEQDFKDLQNLI